MERRNPKVVIIGYSYPESLHMKPIIYATRRIRFDVKHPCLLLALIHRGKMVAVEEITIERVHGDFRDGTFTAKELASTFLEPINKLERARPKINSTLAITPTAPEEAVAATTIFPQHGIFKGRFHSIHILVKGQADAADMKIIYGSGAIK